MPRIVHLLCLLLFSQSMMAQSAVAFMGKSSSSLSSPIIPDKTPAIVYIPFALEGGMIFVDAEIEGEKASFILDTGAPGLVINEFGVGLSDKEKIEVEGVQGSATVNEVEISSFQWAGLKHRQVSAYVMDMRAFEDLTGRNIKGLIGYEFFKDQELLIDYDNQMIRLTRIDRMPSSNQVLATSVPFQKLAHLPIVKMKINGKVGFFGLDTGSEINIIHSRWKRKLKNKTIRWNQILGVDGQCQQVERIPITDTRIGSQIMQEMEFHFVDLSTIEKEYGIRLDGILGFPFFSSNKVSIDFEAEQLSFYEPK